MARAIQIASIVGAVYFSAARLAAEELKLPSVLTGGEAAEETILADGFNVQATASEPAEPRDDRVSPPMADGPVDGDVEEAFQHFCPADMLADLWIVNTRGTACACNCAAATRQIRFRRRQGCQWLASDLDEFVSTAESWRPIVVWLHGNNTSEQEARSTGMQVYRLITRGHAQPIRFVIWSWPSERDNCRVVRDLRMKADISNAQGYYLAWFLDQLAPDATATLIGYSYGTRLLSSGLHIRAVSHSRAETDEVATPNSLNAARTMLIAPAQDHYCFAPRGQYRFAALQMSQLWVFFNPCDPVLHWYPCLEGHGGPPALGAVGLSQPLALPLDPSQIRQTNVQNLIGAHHGLDYFLDSPGVVARMRQFVYESALQISAPVGETARQEVDAPSSFEQLRR